MNPGDFSNDLDWQAFCYVADELNEAEREAFESRLADDQAARDALVRAVVLSRIVGESDIAWERRSAWRIPQFEAVAIAAGIVFCLITAWLVGRPSNPRPVADVAMVWAESVEVPEWNQEDVGTTLASWSEVDAVDVELDSFASSGNDTESEQVESIGWMFAALDRDVQATIGE